MPTHKCRRAVVLTSRGVTLGNFRGPLIETMVRRGLEVYAFAPDFDERTRRAIVSLGATPVDYPLLPAGLNPLKDTRALAVLRRLFASIEPDLLFSYFIKPVIYGSLAGRWVGIPNQFSLIAGLGYAFGPQASSGVGLGRRLLRGTVKYLYRTALRFNQKVFVQNHDDAKELTASGIVPPEKLIILPGTGVDLRHFHFAPPVTSPVRFLWMGRLLQEKGVLDFVAAARLVRQQFPKAEFMVVGGADDNPDAIDEVKVKEWVRSGLIQWPGMVSDVRPWLERASVFVLPSYYREGKPRTIQEAMAMGRPIITTDSPGCRETVEPGRNGFLVPVRQPAALAEAMRRFLAQPQLIEEMGRESRRMAEETYDVHAINEVMLNAMGI